MKKPIKYFYLLLSLVALVACEKMENTETSPESNLVGRWLWGPKDIYSSLVEFQADGRFSITNTTGIGFSTQRTGTWNIKGDSLKVKVTEQLELTVNDTLAKTQVDTTHFNEATYKIQNSILAIRYLDDQPDANVATEIRFSMVQP